MKFSFKRCNLIFLLILGFITQTENRCEGAKNPKKPTEMEPIIQEISIHIENRTFTATMADNESTKALGSLLPLTLDMEDLNHNEKFARLHKNLPTQSFSPGTIKKGDLLLWGNNTVVIFYETFSSSHSYTRLGTIDDPNELKEALGTGNVKVRFEIDPNR